MAVAHSGPGLCDVRQVQVPAVLSAFNVRKRNMFRIVRGYLSAQSELRGPGCY
jgi:hypothetical protein